MIQTSLLFNWDQLYLKPQCVCKSHISILTILAFKIQTDLPTLTLSLRVQGCQFIHAEYHLKLIMQEQKKVKGPKKRKSIICNAGKVVLFLRGFFSRSPEAVRHVNVDAVATKKMPPGSISKKRRPHRRWSSIWCGFRRVGQVNFSTFFKVYPLTLRRLLKVFLPRSKTLSLREPQVVLHFPALSGIRDLVAILFFSIHSRS